MGNMRKVNPQWKIMPCLPAVLGMTLIAVLAGCGGSSPSPASTAIPSVNLTASGGITPSQACDAAKSAWSAFNSAYPAATDDLSKEEVAVQWQATFGGIAFALASNALTASSATAITEAALEHDADTTADATDPIVSDLEKGNTKAAAGLIPGELTTAYKNFEAASCGTGS
jgi:hypothetical protein